MWHVTEDPERWLAHVGHLLLPEPGRHSVALTQVEAVRAKPDGTRFAWWEDSGAAIHCPGYPAILCLAPDEALQPFADLWDVDRISGETSLALHAGAIAAKGKVLTVLAAERLYQLGELHLPDVPGQLRIATSADEPLLREWFGAFVLEAGIPGRPDLRATVPDRIERGVIGVWDHDGPQAMCGRQRAAFGCVRLGPVFTPPEHRSQGYGGAATAAMARRAQDLADQVVLYTDLTNPISNGLYQRLGFRPVETRAVLQISPAQAVPRS